MIRYKIMGAEAFDKVVPPPLPHINSDIGHFSIGPDARLEVAFEDVPIPPKQLWIKARMEFSPCEGIAVIREQSGDSFVWQSEGRCEKVRVTPMQILYGQKDNLLQQDWQLQAEVFEHQFAVTPTIYTQRAVGTLVFWPCGGKASSNLLEIEQLYAQAPSHPTDTKMYVNGASACQKLLAKTDGRSVIFQPPGGQKLTLAEALGRGEMVIKIADSDLQYMYASILAENPEKDSEFIQILCERKDQ